mmetsp:Transcript_23354/g.34954  ORF Transcript_23354/g.34954 Transcript_23354/m.34954 type:complete len:399 (-) Transcript_23354:350-1546(-)
MSYLTNNMNAEDVTLLALEEEKEASRRNKEELAETQDVSGCTIFSILPYGLAALTVSVISLSLFWGANTVISSPSISNGLQPFDGVFPSINRPNLNVLLKLSTHSMGCMYIDPMDAILNPDLHNTSIAPFYRSRSKGEKPLFKWEEVQKSANTNGHRFCRAVRDNWACKGPRYEEMLNSTEPHESKSCSLTENLPVGTRIYWEGNSHIAQAFWYMVCESNFDHILNIGTLYSSHSVVVYHAPTDILLLMIDNDDCFLPGNETDINDSKTIELLTDVGFSPHLIVFGDVNYQSDNRRTAQKKSLIHRYPDAKFLDVRGSVMPAEDCVADFMHCVESEVDSCRKHACMPGPVARHADLLAKMFGHGLCSNAPHVSPLFYERSQRCLTNIDIKKHLVNAAA